MDQAPLSPAQADHLPPLLSEAAVDPASVAPEEAARLGRALLDSGEPTLAFPLLLRALEAEPGIAERWLAIQEALIATGMFDGAHKLIGQVQQLGFEAEVIEEMRRRLLAGTTASLSRMTPLAASSPAPAGAASAPGLAGSAAKASPQVAAKLLRARKAMASGRTADAEAEFRAILKIEPYQAEAINSLSGLLRVQDRVDDAVALLRQGIAAHPGLVALPLNLARILIDAGRHDEAERDCRTALALAPAASNTNLVMGQFFALQRQDVLAERHFRTAVQADPDSAEALVHLGKLLQRGNRQAEAEAAFRRAIALKSDRTDAYRQLADLYAKWGVPAEAEAWLRKALAIDPRNGPLWLTLTHVHFNIGQVEEALKSARAGLAVEAGNTALHNVHLFTLLHAPGRSTAEVFAAHRAFGRRLEAEAKPMRHRPDAAAAVRRPRIGLVSGDFAEHVVSAWFLPLWEKLQQRGYEIHAYATSDRDDQVTQRLRGFAAGWRVIRGLADDAAAKRIREDGIDILVDLAGHTNHNRLGIFARKPAPVQVSYLGYPATTGMSRMDYYALCGGAVPEGLCDEQFTEKLVRLPRAYMFDLQRFTASEASVIPEVRPLPALTNGHITFGSFNRISKSDQSVVDLWARAMHAVPNSHFLVAGMKGVEMVATMIARFAKAGIPEDRLMFRRHSPDYLQYHHEVDMLLDSFPYAGGTTTSIALRMGVPVLALAGDTYVSRSGIVLTHHVGLEGFVATTPEEFVARAAHWSDNLQELAAIRARLPGQMDAAMRQSDLAARGFDAAFRAMWRRFCEGQAPAAITITPEQLGGPGEEMPT
ncbi:tetratricopeptide repeat protein [Roseomonas hellenica]|uniref:protein O-GlcNAc transferase n=1 Tax=Plastoroseomonas hellenica TaxID=2687306 RepID=A0ABS5F5X5_9PROT|nr:tetratricopeptide repeat protein [Plastoroseomonas hellenica]MBR0667970.1 tetratricopeptide repeat protein [Plastoroseomonas hellenica]